MTNEDKQWITEALAGLKDTLIEEMRNMQTEILRGFKAHSDGLTIRLRKIEADQANLDLALSRRVEIVEQRLLEIETKLDHLK